MPSCPTLILMVIGWFVVMNILQPRLMQGAVGIHPIVVLGSVLIGVADRGHRRRDLRHPDRGGRVGVLLPFLHRTAGDRTVAGPGRRAASRSARAGRSAIPREPTPGSAADIDDDPSIDAGRPTADRADARRPDDPGRPEEEPDVTATTAHHRRDDART